MNRLGETVEVEDFSKTDLVKNVIASIIKALIEVDELKVWSQKRNYSIWRDVVSAYIQ